MSTLAPSVLGATEGLNPAQMPVSSGLVVGAELGTAEPPGQSQSHPGEPCSEGPGSGFGLGFDLGSAENSPQPPSQSVSGGV